MELCELETCSKRSLSGFYHPVFLKGSLKIELLKITLFRDYVTHTGVVDMAQVLL